MFVSDSPERWIGWPLRTSAGPPPTASVTVDQSGGNETRIFTGAPTGASFASFASSLPRATRTAPLRGIGTALRLTVDVTVPVRSWNGVAGGNGDTPAASAFHGGVDAPHAGVKSPVELTGGGSLSGPIGYGTPLKPCQ